MMRQRAGRQRTAQRVPRDADATLTPFKPLPSTPPPIQRVKAACHCFDARATVSWKRSKDGAWRGFCIVEFASASRPQRRVLSRASLGPLF
jgi:hypothetical protein